MKNLQKYGVQIMNTKEIRDTNGGRIPFAPLNRLNFLWDVAKAGWRFGKYLAK
ncbi:hypothetical protein [Tenacibaculum piscium]|uniref:hypothetical protein n=1 Tax=Tenacibaculum piscium TaxID=1458515 RepID=UPI001F48E1E5|nr:hypothetical protein [Tenacibaculum piscium]